MMTMYGLHWVTKSLGKYSQMLVRKFYASYAATMHHSLPKGKKPLTQPRLIDIWLRGRWVDISEETIYHMLFDLEYYAPISIVEFDYRVGQTHNLLIMKDLEHQATLIRWVRGILQRIVWNLLRSPPIWSLSSRLCSAFSSNFGRLLFILASG